LAFRIILESFAVTAKKSEAQSISVQDQIGAWGFALPSSSTLIVEFEKRSQLFIRVHNEALSVVAMRVSTEDRSPI